MLKKLTCLLISAAILTGCSSEIDFAEVQIRNNLVYKYGDTDPFTGRVVNQPTGLPGLTLANCNSEFIKGRLDGSFVCQSSGNKVYEANYNDGKKDGIESSWDPKTKKELSATNWKDGLKDGVEKVYREGVLISEVSFKEGKPDGSDKKWSLDGKTLTTDLQWASGKKTGIENIDEGKFHFNDGELDGDITKYDYYAAGAGKYVKNEEHYSNGKLDGTQKAYRNILHTKIVVPESEIFYEQGIAISGWLKEYNLVDGKLIQNIPLVQSPNRSTENFNTDYPGNLVPDGKVNKIGSSGEIIGEATWQNGIKIRTFTNLNNEGENYPDQMFFQILDKSSNKLVSVSAEQYYQQANATEKTGGTSEEHTTVDTVAVESARCSPQEDDNCYVNNQKIPRAELGKYLKTVNVEDVERSGGYCEYPVCYNAQDKPIGIR